MAELGLGAGPPAPATPPPPDEWIARLGTLPLAHQPGERWLYHTGAEVLGVLVSRAAGQPLDAFMRERIFEPLGHDATPGSRCRRRRSTASGPATARSPTRPYDPADGQWSHARPRSRAEATGLVSTIDDYLAFARMLRAGGAYDGGRLLARPTVEAMTTNQLGDAPRPALTPSGAAGWGFGVRRAAPADRAGRPVGSYGWDGGLGSSWANDPAEGLIGVLLTNQMWTSPSPPAVCRDFWTERVRRDRRLIGPRGQPASVVQRGLGLLDAACFGDVVVGGVERVLRLGQPRRSASSGLSPRRLGPRPRACSHAPLRATSFAFAAAAPLPRRPPPRARIRSARRRRSASSSSRSAAACFLVPLGRLSASPCGRRGPDPRPSPKPKPPWPASGRSSSRPSSNEPSASASAPTVAARDVTSPRSDGRASSRPSTAAAAACLHRGPEPLVGLAELRPAARLRSPGRRRRSRRRHRRR